SPRPHLPEVPTRGAALLRILHDEAHRRGGELTRISHLTTRLRVERRAIEHHLALLAGDERIDRRALLQDRPHAPGAAQALVAREQRVRVERGAVASIHTKLARFLRTAPLFLHRR